MRRSTNHRVILRPENSFGVTAAYFIAAVTTTRGIGAMPQSHQTSLPLVKRLDAAKIQAQQAASLNPFASRGSNFSAGKHHFRTTRNQR